MLIVLEFRKELALEVLSDYHFFYIIQHTKNREEA